MNFCACWVPSVCCCWWSSQLHDSSLAYLDVLDGNTTHFVGIAGDCRGREKEALKSCRVLRSMLLSWTWPTIFRCGSLTPAGKSAGPTLAPVLLVCPGPTTVTRTPNHVYKPHRIIFILIKRRNARKLDSSMTYDFLKAVFHDRQTYLGRRLT